jgi:hypothetical protein
MDGGTLIIPPMPWRARIVAAWAILSGRELAIKTQRFIVNIEAGNGDH